MNEVKLLFRKDLWVLKNNILLILRNPARLIPYAGLIGYFFFIYTMRMKDRAKKLDNSIPEMDVNGLPEVDFATQNIVGGITVLALGFLLYQLFRATKRNVSFFTMADVNLLFTGPVKPQNILLYYMGRSILPSLGGSIIFLIYGGSQMAGSFELSLGNILFILLGFALFFFILSPIRFLIYTLHTKYDILEKIKTLITVLAVLLAIMILIPGLTAEKFWQGMFSWVASPWFDLFPFVGWSRGMMGYLVHQNLILAFAFLGLYILSYYLIVRLVIQFAGYYYEDVLEATKSNEVQRDKVKGKRENSEATYSLNTKKQLALPDFGVGAKAFYWRNYVHASRQDFHPLFGVYSLIIAGLGIVFAILSNFDWFSHKVLNGYVLVILGFYFLAGIGRASVGDLKKPYFFLIPATWTSKFWNVIKLDIVQILLFAVVMIVPSVLIAGLHILVIPVFILGILVSYMIGLCINLIPQISLEESWDRKLIKPAMMIGIFLFGIIPALVLGILVFVFTRQFVWMLLTVTIGMSFVAGILIHVALDVLSRLEFKEEN
ncbi:putative ABC exporter domain-containing protein [Algoriphagus limi]|uniref:ABC exporter domain-containing protein n=1 Tax=Algoriphagus limi TaxID=2975273 RepID=A0ABT2G999_9BACT|nr:putative ABC exporter domain-containing protein [Algoriphagus limi]MCS5491840.1 putative ABC exporter domain-containing protein [Algoriphagus limi]